MGKTKIGLVVSALVTIGTIFLLSGTAEAFSGVGAGTDIDPFEITSCATWLEMNDDLDASYELKNDISCTATSYTPIGTVSDFTGSLAGNGYTISDVTATGTYVGLFAQTMNARIEMLTIADSTFTGTLATGSLAGVAENTDIKRVHTDADVVVNGPGSMGVHWTGGLIGFVGMNSTIAGSSASGTVNSHSPGGLVGSIDSGSIVSSYADGIVNGTSYAGGLVSTMFHASIAKSYAAVSLNTTGTGNGGLVAYVYEADATIDDSFSATDMSGVSGGSGHGGMFGLLNGTANNVVYDVFASGFGDCVGSGTGTSNCTAVNVADSEPAYFQNNFTNSPLDTWVNDSWWVVTGNYPNFMDVALSNSVLCEDPMSTATSSTIECDIPLRASWHEVSWAGRHKLNADSTWTYVSVPDSAVGTFTTRHQLPYTSYDLSLRPTLNGVELPWATQNFLTLPDNDDDGDGILNSVEQNGPNLGDADDDGTEDYTQANVAATVNSITEGYVVVASSCNGVEDLSVSEESTTKADAGYDYHSGVVSFVAVCVTPGATGTFTVLFFGDYDSSSASTLRLRKFNPTTGLYMDISSASLTLVTVGGQSALQATYQVVDGGPLDADGTVDGSITDPVGLGSAAAAIVVNAPNTGLRQQSVLTIVVSLIAAGILLALSRRLDQ